MGDVKSYVKKKVAEDPAFVQEVFHDLDKHDSTVGYLERRIKLLERNLGKDLIEEIKHLQGIAALAACQIHGSKDIEEARQKIEEFLPAEKIYRMKF